MLPDTDKALGQFLRDRRSRLDAAAFGFGGGRRRTPGLRREEGAQRANISPTWYTWLEQGGGGAPPAGVVKRVAPALVLSHNQRGQVFLLRLGRPPAGRLKAAPDVTPPFPRLLPSP